MSQGYGYRSERRLRKENQDTFGVFEFGDVTVLVVCDGMGGHVGGRQASSIAVRTIHDEFAGADSKDYRGTLKKAVEAANRAIYETARKNYRLMGMGTTCVATVIAGNVAHIAHVGDSRVYLVRDGQIRALTRDHTMVNLFVDAELLSPEDAATHPEAHVLSRSLGVERQVEVELAEPLHLKQQDRVLLCSDGVHGVVGTAGLGNIDWGNPQDGVDASLAAVERAEGDDNATLIAFGPVIVGLSSPTTHPPSLDALEEEAKQAEVQTTLQPVRRPEPISTQPMEEDVVPVEQLDADAAASSDEVMPRRAPQAKKNRKIPVPVLAIGGLTVAAIVLALALFPRGRTVPTVETPAVPAPTETVEVDVAAPGAGALIGDGSEIRLASAGGRGMFRDACLDCTGSFALPTASAYLSGESDPKVAVAFFAPEVPPTPRRGPQSQSMYDRPPPNSPESTKAVTAARNNRCREALDTVRDAMRRSIDYASLYGVAWFCFNDTHQADLTHARAATWEDFQPLLVHFEGAERVRGVDAPSNTAPAPDAPTPGRPARPGAAPAASAAAPAPAEGDAIASADAARSAVAARRAAVWDKPMPDNWKVPATGGIEYRLALFESDTDIQGFRDIMIDLQGEPKVADHLAVDVLLEATAAASLARMDDPTPQAVQVWARRVYVASRAMTGDVGKLIWKHRPELAGQIEALLFEATGGDDGLAALEDQRPNDAVPPLVARAQNAGLAGEMFDRFDLAAAGAPLAPVASDDQLASSDGAAQSAYRGRAPVRRTYSRSYARVSRTTRPTEEEQRPSTAQDFDWDEFGYLKVWYPRRRMPRLLKPVQRDATGVEPSP